MASEVDITEHRNHIQESFLRFLSHFPLRISKSLYKNPDIDDPILYIWGPGWEGSQQKASFDQECLQWQTFLLFNKIDFKVKNVNEPLISPSGKLPLLYTSPGDIFTSDKIPEFIKNKQRPEDDTEASTPDPETPFICLADTKLRNALLFYLWCEPANYEKVTFHKYGGHYPKPLDTILMYKARKAVIGDLLTRKPILNANEIYEEADEALKAFSVELEDSKYFFGSRSSPKLIDAVVFSYIYTILSIPVTSSDKELHELVHKYKNL
ncbi:12658_t:CDS:2 [Ambispora gerdemannii]|uniref:12658_t:CDS:1 n=1 Tax=Ambispora gerdemannii TaxID=144530 RepID=A0A9N9FV96_9GLOM|nr:12658_t:CDS:2 [Ambispora gerdemannii]